MWTQKNRPRYDRDHLRYPSDLTDEEWAVVAPLIPAPRPGGGKRRTDMRAVVNGTGCQWRYLPKDFPPHSTVYNYFVWWQCDRVLDRIRHALYVECREGRNAEAQSHRRHHRRSERRRALKKGGLHRSAWLRCRHQLIKGKKRHILVDTLGLLLHASAYLCRRRSGPRWRPAVTRHAVWQVSIPREAVCRQRLSGPIFIDGLAEILTYLKTEIIKRSDRASGFVQLPKRWIVERTIAWLNRCRRLAKDWENLNYSGVAFLKLASIRLMLRKLCNPC